MPRYKFKGDKKKNLLLEEVEGLLEVSTKANTALPGVCVKVGGGGRGGSFRFCKIAKALFV